jgi:polysaccharide biosynthesis protein VpsJ
MRTDSSEDTHVYLEKVHEWFELAEKLEWKSYDPFDFLQSPYLGWIQRYSSISARILVQIGKHSGFNARRLLKIAPHQEAKTISDYLSAAILLVRSGEPSILIYIDKLFNMLLARAITTPNGFGWGLEFPYASRFVNVPKRTPNAYTTASVVNSCLDLFELTQKQEALTYAWSGCCFILKDLGNFQFGRKQWFQYWPNSNIPVVNVQALLAGLFKRAGKLLKNQQLLSLADECVDITLTAQRDDGSWFYSEDGRANFIDGFHTGFILQGLADYVRYGRSKVSEVEDSIDRGFQFFKQHLISIDAKPLYFADGNVSQDGQNFAQSIQTFLFCSEGEKDIEMAKRLWYTMSEIIQLREATDSSVSLAGFKDLRWTYGPAVLATAHLINAVSVKK